MSFTHDTKDITGRRILVGDTVAYAYREGSFAILRTGTVKALGAGRLHGLVTVTTDKGRDIERGGSRLAVTLAPAD